MKVTFRPVRSTLAESLCDRVVSTSLRSLLIELSSTSGGAYSIDNLSFSYAGYDNRIDWVYYYLCTSRYYDIKYDTPQIIGYLTFGE